MTSYRSMSALQPTDAEMTKIGPDETARVEGAVTEWKRDFKESLIRLFGPAADSEATARDVGFFLSSMCQRAHNSIVAKNRLLADVNAQLKRLAEQSDRQEIDLQKIDDKIAFQDNLLQGREFWEDVLDVAGDVHRALTGDAWQVKNFATGPTIESRKQAAEFVQNKIAAAIARTA